MNKDNKKISAAMAAVMSYLEEEAMLMQAPPAAATEPVGRSTPTALPSLWGMSGRQELMQMRSMMQLKAFHRTR